MKLGSFHVDALTVVLLLAIAVSLGWFIQLHGLRKGAFVFLAVSASAIAYVLLMKYLPEYFKVPITLAGSAIIIGVYFYVIVRRSN